jgi:Protein of unknown function (DUF1592)/Protein of unknown function (DUF1588)/Protein of unknown function (DUF1595)/Protein of unknown function (DUF1585)
MKAQEMWRSSFLMAGLLSIGAISACTGQIGGSKTGGGSSQGQGSAGSGAGGATSVTTGTGGTGIASATGGSAGTGSMLPPPNMVPIIMGGTPPAENAGTLPMRRLTLREYDHMLADLVGDTTAPAEGANAWSPDAPNAVLFVAPTSTPDLDVNLYNQTADTVVNTALAALAAGKTAGKLSIPCTNPANTAAETTCATQLITTFGLSAYRRPVAAAEQKDLLTLFSTVRGLGQTFSQSIGAMIKGMLQSPNFLYHWEIGPTAPVVGSDGLVPLTSWQVASRLASSLWEAEPDTTLLTAAQAGTLNTPAAVTTQVMRMLADPRSANGLFYFHEQWLFTFGNQGRDLTAALTKSSPLFTASAAAGLQTEFTQFISSVYSGDGTLQTLFTAPYTFANHDLAAIYGATGPATGFAKVQLNPAQRSGIFTQTAFLATMGSPDGTDNPVYRGLTIYLKVLCGAVGSPPMNVPPVNFMTNGTTRTSYDMHGSSSCANACHGLFDPPGFAFENYDGNGAYRMTDANLPVDATGTFQTPGGATLAFQNAVDLSQQLAKSPEAQTCVDRQWTRYLLGRPETMAEAGSMDLAAQKANATAGYSLRDMVTSLMSSKAFLYRQPSAGETL